MVQAVRNGSVDALILDEPFLRYTALMACDVQVVGSLFLPSDYVMGINPNLDLVRMRAGYRTFVGYRTARWFSPINYN